MRNSKIRADNQLKKYKIRVQILPKYFKKVFQTQSAVPKEVYLLCDIAIVDFAFLYLNPKMD